MEKARRYWKIKKQVQTTVQTSDFVEKFAKDVFESILKHVERVKNQYTQMKILRGDLEDGHILFWMDYAENFTCVSLDEVQSAYQQVTLHTTDVYFPESHSKTQKY